MKRMGRVRRSGSPAPYTAGPRSQRSVGRPSELKTHAPPAFAPRLRAIAAEVDPTIRVYEPLRMDEQSHAELEFLTFWTWLAAIVSGLAVLLSLAGIYAVMSFTVSRRTREIGIRVALGSDPRRVAAAIFRRPATQVAVGVMLGAATVTALLYSGFGALTLRQGGLLAAYTILMLAICALACVVPTRRALRVQPMEAMRAEA